MTEKKRGRPAQFSERMHPVSTRLPESLHDALMRLAIRRGQSVHEIVRNTLSNAVSVARTRQDSGRPS